MENLSLRLMCKNEIKKCNLTVETFDDLEYIKQIEKNVLKRIEEYNAGKDKFNYYFITDKPENIGDGPSNFRFNIDDNNKFVYHLPGFNYDIRDFKINNDLRLYNIYYNTSCYAILVSTYNNIVNKIKIDSNKSIEENLKAEFVLTIGTELPSEMFNEQANKAIIDNIWEYYQKRAIELFGKP